MPEVQRANVYVSSSAGLGLYLCQCHRSLLSLFILPQPQFASVMQTADCPLFLSLPSLQEHDMSLEAVHTCSTACPYGIVH
jgi:hypothetical protein